MQQVIPQLHFSFSEREIGSSQGVSKVTGGLYSGHNSPGAVENERISGLDSDSELVPQSDYHRGVTASQSRSQTNCVELHSVSVALCNTRAGNNEQGSRSVVQRESPLRRMDTSPTGGDSVVAEIRTGCGQAATQCPLFFSLVGEDTPLGVDALAHLWPNTLLYAFPLLSLIGPTLQRVQEFRHSLILIAPYWLGKLWIAEIIPLLYDQPWPLLLRRDILR